jgi:serine/threonine protein kinase
MNTGRQQLVEDIYASARQRQPLDRPPYLAQACLGDPELLREVEEMLSRHENQQATVILGPVEREWIGPYRVESRIGAGGMGEVYRARDSRLKREVAIKVLPTAHMKDQEARDRLLKEAQAASALNHPSIVTVYDIGSDRGMDYLVMEYVKGNTFDHVIAAGRLSLSDLIRYGTAIASPLAAAHSIGIVHRDIKPANIMITTDGQVKILDFGLAKQQPTGGDPDATVQMSTPGVIMGTISYMSPEQAQGQMLDGRSDIFSLGVVLYEAATGTLPFKGSNAMAILHAVVSHDPPKPSSLNPSLPDRFDRVIARALAKNKQERFETADQLSEALRDINQSGELRQPPSGAPPAEPQDGAVRVDVLFLDIVKSTRQNTDVQHLVNRRLKEIIQNTSEFRRASARGELISLPTGDGAALVFTQSPEAPLRSAIEIARQLKAQNQFQVRMGIHSGIVYIGPDVNGNPNVSGEGINMAQRVMSCGASGHILLSPDAATALRNITAWKDKIVFLGDYRCKDDIVSAWSYVDSEVGSNAPLEALPLKAAPVKPWAIAAIFVAALLALAGFFGWRSRLWVEERNFSYSLLLKNPNGPMADVAPYSVLHVNDNLKLKIASPQDGFLYILSESPSPNAPSTFSWLFPEPDYQGSSAAVKAQTVLSVPTPAKAFIVISPSPEADVIHFIWSKTPLENLETVKMRDFNQRTGDLSTQDIAVVKSLLGAGSSESQEIRKGSETLIQGRVDPLTAHFTLGHM